MQGDTGECYLAKDSFINSINDEKKQKLETRQRDVGKIVKNVRNVLRDLERSIKKSSKYESEFLSSASSSGYHSHVPTESGWKTDRESKVSFADNDVLMKNDCRSEVNLSDSWSTMSIVCLQYQYDELSRKYQNLLRVHNERCKDMSCRDTSLADCHLQLDATLVELEAAHTVVHKICSKYLALKRRKDRDKANYEEKIAAQEEMTTNLMTLLEASRNALDDVLSDKMAGENDSSRALLMAEIRRSNQLFQENLQLKARIEELAPGTVSWHSSLH